MGGSAWLVCPEGGGVSASGGSASREVCQGKSASGGSAMGGGSAPRGVCLWGCWADPPVNRMTHRCKNITLPQTSFAGGKNVDKIKQESIPAGYLRSQVQRGSYTVRSNASWVMVTWDHLPRNLCCIEWRTDTTENITFATPLAGRWQIQGAKIIR